MAAPDVFERRSRIDAPAAEVFAWHLRDGAFERLLPPGDGTIVLERTGSIEQDTMRVTLSVPVLGPIRQRWDVRHEGYVAGHRFVDVMERGPFSHWRHEHRIEVIDDGSCELVDHVEYSLPAGALGRTFGGGIVRRRLDSMFDHRHAVTRNDVSAHTAASLEPLRIELVGRWRDRALQQQVAAFLATGGHLVATPRPLAGARDVHEFSDPDVRITQDETCDMCVELRDGPNREVDLVGSAVMDPRRVLSSIVALRATA
ncbi:MAG: SRPBCC family protein [Thermoleophilia bacterium]|nr:SRPBCC family protein [Thermoleophilia bacterium]